MPLKFFNCFKPTVTEHIDHTPQISSISSIPTSPTIQTFPLMQLPQNLVSLISAKVGLNAGKYFLANKALQRPPELIKKISMHATTAHIDILIKKIEKNQYPHLEELQLTQIKLKDFEKLLKAIEAKPENKQLQKLKFNLDGFAYTNNDDGYDAFVNLLEKKPELGSKITGFSAASNVYACKHKHLEALTHKCPNLEHLNLSGSRSLDLRNLDFLQNFSKLQTLILGETNINDLSTLVRLMNPIDANTEGPLANLVHLDLSNCRQLDKREFEHFKQLNTDNKIKILSVANHQISDPSFVLNFTQLEYLNLNRCEISDLAPLAEKTQNGEFKLKHLKELKLSDIVSDDFNSYQPFSNLDPVIDLLPQLEVLDLSQNKNLEASEWAKLGKPCPAHIEKFPLKYLYLSGAKIEDLSNLQQFTELERLSLLNCLSIKGESISVLKNLKKLIYLDMGVETFQFKKRILDRSAFNAIKALIPQLPNLKYMGLKNCFALRRHAFFYFEKNNLFPSLTKKTKDQIHQELKNAKDFEDLESLIVDTAQTISYAQHNNTLRRERLREARAQAQAAQAAQAQVDN